MFEAKRLVFYYAISPVHMGAGQAVGAIDNPIQREVHTEHPLIAGSGIKGALRHHLQRNGGGEWVRRMFGPDTANASEHAGAVSFTDAAIVAFPVRCAKRAYVYATCPTALARLKRTAEAAGVECSWTVEAPPADNQVLGATDVCFSNGKQLLLEVFEFDGRVNDNTKSIGKWFAEHALPSGGSHDYFRDKLASDLVVLPDSAFGHFVRHATVVEPHVAIDNDTGTAASGKLFYTENLPAESLLAGLALSSVERISAARAKNGEKGEAAEKLLERLFRGGEDAKGLAIDGKLVQFGGDATTGRGLVLLKTAL
jgi:CRISPR-associated protein Cmr4